MMNFNYESRFQDIISEVINNKQNIYKTIVKCRFNKII